MDGIEIPIAGVQCSIKNDTLIIASEEQLKTLGSSILGGGFNRTRYILNHHVEKDFFHKSPAAYLKKIALGLEIAAIVTGGVSNAAVSGEPVADRGASGTINTILLIDGRLTRAAMAGAIITATEAKSAALRGLNVKSVATGEPATGTSTDAVVVACTGRGPRRIYSGTATILGELVGRTILLATTEAIKAQEGWQ
jgi:iron complex transport system ATP-binding protein